MNLTERAEIRKETFYKLTNSRNVPEAPKAGGRNLLAKTNQGKTYWAWAASSPGTTAEDYNVNGVNGVKLTRTTDSSVTWQYIRYDGLLRKLIEPGTNYTLSFDVNPSVDVTFTADLKRGDSGGAITNWAAMNKATANQWTKVSCTVTSKSPLISDQSQVVYLSGMPIAKGNWLIAKNIKLEKGDKATPYSQAPEDLGWTTNTLVPTPDQRYLWKFEYIYYSDDSVEVTQPTNISIAGVNGQTSHVHFAFADNATGGGFSLTTPKAYMGWYADFNEAASNDPTKYRWSKWKGDQGLPGKPGADGKTSYFHMAYADSADGRTGFSFKESGQQYQGYYTDFTQTSSTDPTKYAWMDRRAGVEPGTKNLILKSNDFANPHKQNGVNTTVTSTDDYFVIKSTGYTANAWGGMAWNMSIPEVKTGEQFSILMPVYIDSSIDLDNGWGFDLKNHPLNSKAYSYSIPTNKKNEWFNVAVTFKATKDVVFDTYPFYVYIVKNGLVRIKPPMLVRGNLIPSDFVTAPEDVQEDIDSKADQTLTQEQLNALEAKRLQMETEMKALATLQQVSELETFIDNLKKEDLDGRQKIIEITKAIEERVKDIEPIMEYSQKLKFMDTYITQGNGGMIIGANDSTTKVVVTPDRISFQSGGSEVAYISQRMLHIDNGVFTMSLQLGHYITRAHPKNEYVNATYFVK